MDTDVPEVHVMLLTIPWHGDAARYNTHMIPMGMVYLHIFTYMNGWFFIVNVGKCYQSHGSYGDMELIQNIPKMVVPQMIKDTTK